MNRILIAPHFMESEKTSRISVFSALTDFLLDYGFFPEIAVFHTGVGKIKDAEKLAKEYLLKNHIKGLILHGGSNVSPILYNKNLCQKSNSIHIFRDYFELSLIQLAIANKIPILGICRGLQILNVYFGGSLKNANSSIEHIKLLTSDLNSDDVNKMDLEHSHNINIKKESWLFKILSKDKICVNSIHRQTISVLAKDLEVLAKAEDGEIEAVGNLEKKILGLQWHPELDLKNPNNLKILKSWLGVVNG